MKKGIIIGLIVGVVITSAAAVIASNLTAGSVTYTPSDTSWKVNNVSSALNELYQKVPTGSQSITANGTYNIANKASVDVNVPNTLQLVGTYQLDSTHKGTYSTTFNMTSYSNYQNLTQNNFYVVIEEIAPACGDGGSNVDSWNSIIKSYNKTSGIFTLELPLARHSNCGLWIYGSVYLYR